MTTVSERVRTGGLPDLARGPVLVLAAAVGVLLTAVSGRYGYFGDELYFLAAGRHLAWGYADQPPLLPLIAAAMDAIGPGSVAVLRIPATLATVAGVVLTALLAREFGGGRRAQLVAAGAFAVSPNFLATGHLLATSTLDPALWIALTWLLVRWVRTRSDRLLFAAGLVTLIGSVLAVHGLGRMLRAPEYRFLGVTALGVAALFLVTGGRPPTTWPGCSRCCGRPRPSRSSAAGPPAGGGAGSRRGRCTG